MVAQDLEQRRAARLLLAAWANTGVSATWAHEQADGEQHDAEQERDPPAPREELPLAGRRGGHGQRQVERTMPVGRRRW